MAYNIYKADGTPISVPDNIIDSQFYSPSSNGPGKGIGTQLIGRNAIDYGAPVAQNFLQLTENFCGSIFPSDSTALQGQLWFNKSSSVAGELYVRVTNSVTGGIVNWRRVFLDDGSGGIPASSLLGGDTGTVVYQSATDVTAFLPRGTSSMVLISGTSPSWTNTPVLTGTNFIGIPNSALINGGIPTQTGHGGKYLTTNGTEVSWAIVPSGGGGGGSGTVGSVDVSGGTTGLVFTGGPVTSTGVITMAGTLAIASGGTGAVTAPAARTALGAAPLNSPSFTGTVTITARSTETSVAAPGTTLDLVTSNYFTRQVVGNTTFIFSSPPAAGNAFAFTFEVDHQGGNITWPAAVKWPGDTAPSLTTGKTHLFFFVTDNGGTRWRASSLINYTT